AGAGAALPRADPGPARSRRRPARPRAVPVGGVRGRRGGRRPRARHGTGDPGRLLHGWHGRAGVLAPAPRADGRPRALCDGPDPAVRRAVLERMRRMPLVTALAAMQSVCDFSSHRWIGSVEVPTAVL